MTTADLQQLNFDELVDHWTAYFRQLLPEDLRRIFPPMLRELAATGQPVASQRLADLSGVPLERALALLRLMPTEWDKSGERVVGNGLTTIPTQHRYETQGNTMWTFCAGDSLLFVPVIGAAARVQSPCAATGDPITIEATPTSVQHVEPASAVVSTLTPTTDLAGIRRNLCSQHNFYRSAEAAAPWLATFPQGRVMPVAEAFEMLRRAGNELDWVQPPQS